MRIFVIQTQPTEESYSAAIRDRVIESLQHAGHDVTLSRLGGGAEQGPDDLDGYQALVLINPIWWGGMPAHLLGWVQRVLGPAIDRTGAGDDPSPLSTIDHLVAVVTHGSSRFLNQVEGEPAKFLLQKAVLPLCADNASFDWVSLYKLDRRTPSELGEFIDSAAAKVVDITSGSAA